MPVEKNKVLAQQFIEKVWNQGNLEAVDELLATDIVWHNTPILDVKAFKENLVSFRTGWPDVNLDVEDMIAEGDKVTVRLSAHGTHTGPWWGFEPTGKHATWTGMAIVRIEDGKIVEVWANEGALGRLQQIGVTLKAPESDE